MALSAFDDKASEPGADELRRTLGRSGARWDELIEHLATKQAPLDTGWTYAGANWGWSLRLKRKKRTILYLTPRDRHFLVGFALGEKAVAAAHEAGLPEDVLAGGSAGGQNEEGPPSGREARGDQDGELTGGHGIWGGSPLYS